MLEIKGINKSFGFGRRKIHVLKGVDLEMKEGEMVALMGPSGCGKSTLLNIIGGLLAADEGGIDLKGVKYGKSSPSNVVDVRRSSVGWIFQDFHLLNHLTAKENVVFALELSGAASTEATPTAPVQQHDRHKQHHRIADYFKEQSNCSFLNTLFTKLAALASR